MEQQQIQKRSTAQKVTIQQIHESKYVVVEGWEPNYLQTPNKRIERINIICTFLENNPEKPEEGIPPIAMVEDWTATIQLRIFENNILKNFIPGDVVQIIGKPREYNNEKYIVPEIIRKIDKIWVDIRKKELMLIKEEQPIEKIEEIEEIEDKDIKENPTDKLLENIKSKDKGDGVEINNLIKEGIEEKIISNLIAQGEIYEIRPGIIKVLE